MSFAKNVRLNFKIDFMMNYFSFVSTHLLRSTNHSYQSQDFHVHKIYVLEKNLHYQKCFHCQISTVHLEMFAYDLTSLKLQRSNLIVSEHLFYIKEQNKLSEI